MAGRFTNRVRDVGLREWNALLDPHATSIVYRAAIGMHRSVGLDVTHNLKLDAAEVRRRLDGGRSPLLRDMTETWFGEVGSITFHDPLAAATIFDDRLCQFERGSVEVELASERLAGLTHWTAGGPDPRHQVAIAVDHQRFFGHYFSVVQGMREVA
jgi:inosine-uridine nucleoside N-ribohydrolase